MNDTAAIRNPALVPSELALLDARFPVRNVPVRAAADVGARGAARAGAGLPAWHRVERRVRLDTALGLAPQAGGLGRTGCASTALPALPGPPTMPSGWAHARRARHRPLHAGRPFARRPDGGAAARRAPRWPRGSRLVLISPAVAAAPAMPRNGPRARSDRPCPGLASPAWRRDARLLTGAGERARQWVRWNMARLNESGYARRSNCCAAATCWPTAADAGAGGLRCARRRHAASQLCRAAARCGVVLG
jgi:hypothetical protein